MSGDSLTGHKRDRDAYGRDEHGREAYGREAYGREAYGREAYGREAYGREAYGRDARGRDEPGEIHSFHNDNTFEFRGGDDQMSQTAWARKRRSAKWNWVNHQVDYKLEQDVLRAQRLAESCLKTLGYPREIKPSFGEVMQIMDRMDSMRQFVWDKMDVPTPEAP